MNAVYVPGSGQLKLKKKTVFFAKYPTSPLKKD